LFALSTLYNFTIDVPCTIRAYIFPDLASRRARIQPQRTRRATLPNRRYRELGCFGLGAMT